MYCTVVNRGKYVVYSGKQGQLCTAQGQARVKYELYSGKPALYSGPKG